MDERNELLQLPRGWAWTRLGDIIAFEYGKGLVESKRDAAGKVPVYGSNGLVGYHSTALVDKPCLIVGRKGSAGRVHISKVPCWAIDTTYYVIPPDGAELSFLYYLLSNLKLSSLDKSTAIPGLNRNDAYALIIPLPPLPEQHRIAAKIEELFSDLDAGVAALRKIQTQLKRYRQAVLKAAVEGKLTAEWRAANAGKVEPASALLERIRAERATVGAVPRARPACGVNGGIGGDHKGAPLRASDAAELPALPEGWAWTRVREISAMIQYGTSEKANENSSGFPVVRMGNIQEGGISFEALKYLPGDSPHLSEFILEDGDVLFNRTNSAELVGKTAVYKRRHPRAVFASYLIRVKVDKDAYDPDMLSFFINSFHGRRYIGSVVSQQVGQANVNGTKLAQMPIPIPPLTEQQQIVAEVERRLSVADEVERTVDASLKQAERLRQSILKRAFAGKLVPQDPNDEPAERLVERIKMEKETRANLRDRPDGNRAKTGQARRAALRKQGRKPGE